jgi:hypothetical protein
MLYSIDPQPYGSGFSWNVKCEFCDSTGFRVLHDFMTDASDLVAQLTSWNGEIPRANTSDLGDQLAIVLSGRDRGATLNQRLSTADTSIFVPFPPLLLLLTFYSNQYIL